MAVAKAKAAPRTITREEPAARMEETRTPERDPNAIYTRDGRVVDLKRVTNHNKDYSNLAAMGIFPPQGWTYEWRSVSIKGAEYTQGIVDDAERGWTAVPAERHPGKMMPMGHKGPITHGGQMLMERDDRLTAISRAHEKGAANEQLNISHSMTGLMARAAPNSGAILDNSHMEAQRGTFFRKEVDPSKSGAVVRGRNEYQYTLDE